MRATAAALLLWGSSAFAVAPTVRLEAGAGVPLTDPQRTYFTPGPGATLGVGLELVSLLDAFVEGSYLFFPQAQGSALSGPGSALTVSVGLKVHRPLVGARVAPWASVSAGYCRTGTLDRPQLAGAVGVSLKLPFAPSLWLGVGVHLLGVFRVTDDAAFQTRDALVLSPMLALEWAPRTAESADDALEADRDGDGVRDADDACPDQRGVAAAKGCPDADPDHDGVLGAADKCPDQPEDPDGFQDDDGCPDPDDDRDGVPDVADHCPREPGPAATDGCPDTDGDGVPDHVDACPKAPGKPGDGGCPQYQQIVVTPTRIELSQKIFFAFGLPTILPRSFPLLDEVVQAMKDRGNACVRVEGHTDSVGSAMKNLELSQNRADAVVQYLSERGIARARLDAKGYGSSLPLESNNTTEGREKNRRVEFVITPCADAK